MQTTITFSNGDQVTSAKLNEIIGGATFNSSDINGTTLAIVGGKLQVNIIAAENMGANSVPTNAIQNGAATSIKIADGAVVTNKLGNLAVTNEKQGNGSITFNKLNTQILPTNSQVATNSDVTLMTPLRALYGQSAAKAYGGFNIQNTNRPIRNNSYNISLLTRISSTVTQVSFGTPMTSVNYFVIPTVRSDTGTGVCSAYSYSASGFLVRHPAEASGLAIDFVVYGVLFGS